MVELQPLQPPPAPAMDDDVPESDLLKALKVDGTRRAGPLHFSHAVSLSAQLMGRNCSNFTLHVGQKYS